MTLRPLGRGLPGVVLVEVDHRLLVTGPRCLDQRCSDHLGHSDAPRPLTGAVLHPGSPSNPTTRAFRPSREVSRVGSRRVPRNALSTASPSGLQGRVRRSSDARCRHINDDLRVHERRQHMTITENPALNGVDVASLFGTIGVVKNSAGAGPVPVPGLQRVGQRDPQPDDHPVVLGRRWRARAQGHLPLRGRPSGRAHRNRRGTDPGRVLMQRSPRASPPGSPTRGGTRCRAPLGRSTVEGDIDLHGGRHVPGYSRPASIGHVVIGSLGGLVRSRRAGPDEITGGRRPCSAPANR